MIKCKTEHDVDGDQHQSFQLVGAAVLSGETGQHNCQNYRNYLKLVEQQIHILTEPIAAKNQDGATRRINWVAAPIRMIKARSI
jgi:hypothetical protein